MDGVSQKKGEKITELRNGLARPPVIPAFLHSLRERLAKERAPSENRKASVRLIRFLFDPSSSRHLFDGI